MGCATANHSNGIIPDDVECDMIVRGGNVSQGYCYPITTVHSTEITSDGLTISLAPGVPESMWASVRGGTGATSIGVPNSLYGIAMEDIPDLGVGKFKIRGIVRAYVKNLLNLEVLPGKPLVPVAGSSPSSVLEATPANLPSALSKYIGHALESHASTPSIAVKMLVNFDGVHGFGAGNNTV